MLLGPNSALGHNSILMIEAQVEYIVDALKNAEKWLDMLDPKSVSQDKFNNFIQKRLQGTVWQEVVQAGIKTGREEFHHLASIGDTLYVKHA